MDCLSVKDILNQGKQTHHDTRRPHPTYALPNAAAIMDTCVEAMVDMAGSAKKCRLVLGNILDDDPKKITVLKSKQLCGYLKKCFPGWLSEWEESTKDEMDIELCNLCRGVGVSGVHPSTIFLDLFSPFVREKLGEHLIHFREVEHNGEIRFEADVTLQARIAGIIAEAANEYFPSPDAIPEWVDEEIVVDLERMVADEEFRRALKKSEDSIGYCMDRLKRTVPTPASYDPDDDLVPV